MFPPPEAAPTPLIRPCHQFRSQRISLDVPHNLVEIRIGLHGKRLVPALVDMPHAHLFAMLLPVADVPDDQFLHEGSKLAILLRPFLLPCAQACSRVQGILFRPSTPRILRRAPNSRELVETSNARALSIKAFLPLGPPLGGGIRSQARAVVAEPGSWPYTCNPWTWSRFARFPLKVTFQRCDGEGRRLTPPVGQRARRRPASQSKRHSSRRRRRSNQSGAARYQVTRPSSSPVSASSCRTTTE